MSEVTCCTPSAEEKLSCVKFNLGSDCTVWAFKTVDYYNPFDATQGSTYCIRPNYRTCSYKRTVKQFQSFQITASVIFLYFGIKSYIVGTHLNCINLSMQFKWVPTTYAFMKKKKQKNTRPCINTINKSFADLAFKVYFSRWIRILLQAFSVILKNLSAQCGI